MRFLLAGILLLIGAIFGNVGVVGWALFLCITKLYDKMDERTSSPYLELLYAVATKHPGETRHATALRYIREAERVKGDTADAGTYSEVAE